MLARVVVENGVKKLVPLTADCGSGNPVGTVIAVYSNKVPNGYLPCNGVAFDTAQFPVLYALLGDNHTPDLRECTLKGIGESGRTVGAHVKTGGLAVGEFVDDRVQDLVVRERVDTGSQGDALAMTGNTTDYENKLSNITKLGARTGATTEVKAVGVNWCIKATSGINENQADNVLSALSPVDTVTSGNMHSVTSNAVNSAIEDITKNTTTKGLSQAGWYKIGSCAYYSNGFALKIFLTSQYNYTPCASHSIDVVYGWVNPKISETCYDNYSVFDKLMITYESNNMCNIFVHYNINDFNNCGVKIIGSSWGSLQTFNFEPADISGFTDYAIFNLGTNGFYTNGVNIT